MAAFHKMMKQAQQMQEKLKEMRVEGLSGGGVVKVVLSGDRHLVSIKIDPSVANPNEIDLLEDLIQAAFQQASGNLEQLQMQEMAKVMPGFPGMGI